MFYKIIKTFNKMNTYLEQEEADKFWEINLEDKTQTIRQGKVGNKGKTKTKKFATEEKALQDAEKQIAKKIEKGYKRPAYENEESNLRFPFFGAGEASYYAWAEVVIRFATEPSKDQQKKIIERAPPPIVPNESDFSGKMLLAGGGQFIHAMLAEAYGDIKKVPVFLRGESGFGEYFEEEEEYEGFRDNMYKFNADIERWILEIHQFCPIEYVYRLEDGESDGTEFSRWHERSLTHSTSLIQAIVSEEGIYRQTEEEQDLFTYSLGGIFNYSEVNPSELPKKFVEFFFPEEDE